MFKDDIKKSVSDFMIIKPVIEDKLNAEIINAEDEESIVSLALDRHAGIDYLIKSRGGLRGLASRIQRGHAWQTYTVRYNRFNGTETEYAKRLRALKENYYYPQYTMQAYIDGDKYDIGICNTRELYEYVEKNLDNLPIKTTYNASFVVVRFDDLKSTKHYTGYLS